MNKYNILIVEDELVIAEMIKEMLLDLNYGVVGISKNYAHVEEKIKQGIRPDLVILDINLNENKDGIDVAQLLSEKLQVPHIYLTSYSDPVTIQRAAQTKPSGYLLKPFDKQDLFATIELLRARRMAEGNILMIKEGRDSLKIDTREVLLLKSDNNYLEVITEKKNYLLRSSMDTFLDQAKDSNLIKVHRSFAVNLRKIDAIQGFSLIVGKHKCPIARSRKLEIKQILEQRN